MVLRLPGGLPDRSNGVRAPLEPVGWAEAGAQGADGSYIRVEHDGTMSCVGCYFHGAQSAGYAIDNDGHSSFVTATGNVRETTAAIGHRNVTVGVEIIL